MMGEAVIFGIAVFIGWLLFDFTREKQWRKVKVQEAFLAAIAGAVGWIILDFFL